MDLNKILIDWFTFSAQISGDPEFEEVEKAKSSRLLYELKEFMGLNKVVFQELPGMYFYRKRQAFDGISFLFDGMRENMGVCCQMSGKGCRTFETFGNGDYEKLFKKCVENHSEMNISRIDIAYDDFEGILDMDKICKNTFDKNWVSPFHWYNVEIGSDGSSVYFGSPSSDLRIRFYDKAKEQKIKEPIHWVRCEIQLRSELAFNFVCSLVKCGIDKIGKLYFGALNNYLRFIILGTDTNRSRCETAEWWLNFVGNLEKIHLYEKPGVEYNEELLYGYVVGQAGNSIHTYIECFGIDNLFEDLIRRDTVPNSRQKMIIDKHNKLSDDEIIYYLYEYANHYGFDDYCEKVFKSLEAKKNDTITND